MAEKRRFDYDEDPEIRELEKRLELPGLLQKAAQAQTRARKTLWLRRSVFLVFLTSAAALAWWFLSKNKTQNAPPGLEQKVKPQLPPPEKTEPTVLPKNGEAPSSPTEKPNSPQKSLPNLPPGKKIAPTVVIAFQALPEKFSPAFRAAVVALKSGRLPEAEQHLAALEKTFPKEEDVRALDEEEEAQRDTLTFLKGLTFMQLRRFREAAQQFSRLDDADKPFREEAQFYLFQSYFLAGKTLEAKAVLKKMRRQRGHSFLKMAEDWLRAAGDE